ncbi:MAG: carbamoyltransferase HypF, partial [Fidelibacterota bacterium]
RERFAFLSQHIGDLDNFETYKFFLKTVDHMKRILEIEPEIIAYDMHPGYLSTGWALEQEGIRLTGIQHHHAHIVSCMGEHRMDRKVIGVSFDGTGYGEDGNVWGGEFLMADYSSYRRIAHFKYVPMPGGDAAVKEPYRMALSHLREVFGDELYSLDLDVLKRTGEKKVSIIMKMMERNINTFRTSSCGRLFDAVSSLLGIKDVINYEGQAAIELEMIADTSVVGEYGFDISDGEPFQVDVKELIYGVVKDLQNGVEPSGISAKFHNTIARIIGDVCILSREITGIETVCLSGGVFQNFLLLKKTLSLLRDSGFSVFYHESVPPNDGGISLGQVLIANERAKY